MIVSRIHQFPPDYRGIELLYIGEPKEDENYICLSRSKANNTILVVPNLPNGGGFFVLSEGEIKSVVEFLTGAPQTGEKNPRKKGEGK
jgi:hypothetical protein